MISRELLADGSFRLSANGSEIRLLIAKPGVVVMQSGSAGDAELGEEVLRELTKELARAGHLQLFADLSLLSRIPPATRDASLEWGKRHKDRLKTTHVLVRSKLVEMALSVIGMFLGGLLEIHGDERSYLAALARTLPEFSGFPDEANEPRLSQRMPAAGAPSRPGSSNA